MRALAVFGLVFVAVKIAFAFQCQDFLDKKSIHEVGTFSVPRVLTTPTSAFAELAGREAKELEDPLVQQIFFNLMAVYPGEALLQRDLISRFPTEVQVGIFSALTRYPPGGREGVQALVDLFARLELGSQRAFFLKEISDLLGTSLEMRVPLENYIKNNSGKLLRDESLAVLEQGLLEGGSHSGEKSVAQRSANEKAKYYAKIFHRLTVEDKERVILALAAESGFFRPKEAEQFKSRSYFLTRAGFFKSSALSDSSKFLVAQKIALKQGGLEFIFRHFEFQSVNFWYSFMNSRLELSKRKSHKLLRAVDFFGFLHQISPADPIQHYLSREAYLVAYLARYKHEFEKITLKHRQEYDVIERAIKGENLVGQPGFIRDFTVIYRELLGARDYDRLVDLFRTVMRPRYYFEGNRTTDKYPNMFELSGSHAGSYILREALVASDIARLPEWVRLELADIYFLSMRQGAFKADVYLSEISDGYMKDKLKRDILEVFDVEGSAYQILRRVIPRTMAFDTPFERLGIETARRINLDPNGVLKAELEGKDDFYVPELITATLVRLGMEERKANIIFDIVQKREVGLWFLRFTIVDAFLEGAKDSIDFLKNITGASFERTQVERYSISTKGQFYETMRDLYEQIGRDTEFWDLFSKDVFEKRYVKDLMDLAVTMMAINGISGKFEFKKFLIEASDGREISGDMLTALRDQGEAALLREVSRVFSGRRFAFSFEQYDDLVRQWGDLEPLWVLVGRLKSMDGGRSAISSVARILQTSITGKFHEYKFYGLTGPEKKAARIQLQMLSDRKRELWAKTRYRVSLVKTEEAAKAEDLLAQVRETIRGVIQNNVIRHWTDLVKSIEPEVNPDIKIGTQSVLEFKGNPTDFFQINGIRTLEEKISVLDNVIRSLEDHVYDLESLIRLIRFVKKQVMSQSIEFKISKGQLDADLTDIETRFKDSRNIKIEDSIIASVLTSDPKLLLMIGDAVNCSSCQNYRTGEYVETLPGYVIDANVQAILSYKIKPNHIAHGKYPRLKEWYQTGRSNGVKVSFDGNLRVFRFEKDGEVIETERLGYAFLRNVIKVGLHEDSGKPGVFLEPDYSQTDPALRQMISQHASLYAEVARSLEAVTEGEITVFSSRNKAGHYSDLSHGWDSSGSYQVIISEDPLR